MQVARVHWTTWAAVGLIAATLAFALGIVTARNTGLKSPSRQHVPENANYVRRPVLDGTSQGVVDKTPDGLVPVQQVHPVDLGSFATDNPNQLGPGDSIAFRTLNSTVLANPNVDSFAVSWSNVYPSGNSYPHILEYSRRTGILSKWVGNDAEYRYTGVTPTMMSSCIGLAGEDYVTEEDLAKQGCQPSFYKSGSKIY